LGLDPENLVDRATPWLSQLREMTEDIRTKGEKSVFKRSVDEKGSEIRGTYELNKTSPNYDSEIQELPEPEIDTSPKVLIIDEINRGNLSKILGELIYGLEYRGEEIDLQYKEFDEASQFGTLTIPKNLFVIGTMNTADRSIILFDAALRRRFSFIPLFPDYDLLAQWLDIDKAFDETEFYAKLAAAQDDKTKNKILSVLALEKINSALTANVSIGREKQIGHTYLFELQEHPDRFKKVWKQEILPLIEEYYFETPQEIEKMFGKEIFETKGGIKEFNEETLRSALVEYTKVPEPEA
jgi:5-methylcytosine-specific restriction protein B